MGYIPLGCDGQGRRPDRAEPVVHPTDPIDQLEDLEDESFRFFIGLLVAVLGTSALILIALALWVLP